MPRLWIPALAIVLLACAACGGTSDSPPTALHSRSSASGAVTPSPSVPAELAGYDASEREAFGAAVDALHRFSRTSDRFIRQGRLTPDQAKFYRKNSVRWTDDWAALAQLVNGRITMRGAARELWTRPLSIDLNAGADEVVVVRRCLDQTKVRVFAEGKEVPQLQLKTPRIYRVQMLKKQAEDHWRTGLPKQGAPC